MRLYELLEQVSDILTPQTHSLYEYLLHTSDDNGFLRTRYCYWDEPVPDHSIPNLEQVLICFRWPYSEGDRLYVEQQYGAFLFGRRYGWRYRVESAIGISDVICH